MDGIRGWIYYWGFRPKPGSIFYSPSRENELSFQETLTIEWFRRLNAEMKKENNRGC